MDDSHRRREGETMKLFNKIAEELGWVYTMQILTGWRGLAKAIRYRIFGWPTMANQDDAPDEDIRQHYETCADSYSCMDVCNCWCHFRPDQPDATPEHDQLGGAPRHEYHIEPDGIGPNDAARLSDKQVDSAHKGLYPGSYKAYDAVARAAEDHLWEYTRAEVKFAKDETGFEEFIATSEMENNIELRVEVALLRKHIEAQSVLFHELAAIKHQLQEQLEAAKADANMWRGHCQNLEPHIQDIEEERDAARAQRDALVKAITERNTTNTGELCFCDFAPEDGLHLSVCRQLRTAIAAVKEKP